MPLRNSRSLVAAFLMAASCSAKLVEIYSGSADSCEFAKDGHCDEPILCGYYTDCTDCGTCSSDVQISQQSNGTLLQDGALVAGAYPTGVDLYVSCLSDGDYVNGTWTPDPDWVDKDCLPGAAVAERKIKSMFCFTNANEKATQCTCWRLLDGGVSMGADCHHACGLTECRSRSQDVSSFTSLRVALAVLAVLAVFFLFICLPVLYLKRRRLRASFSSTKGVSFTTSGPGGGGLGSSVLGVSFGNLRHGLARV